MAYIQKKLKMMRVISSFANGPVNFHSTGPTEDQIQKLISSTGSYCMLLNAFFNQRLVQHTVHFPLAEFESQLTNM